MDNRDIRTVLADLDRKVDALTVMFQKKMEHTKEFPRRLSQRAQDALTIVLDDLRTSRRRSTLNGVVEAMNKIEPNCVTRGGDINDSVRAFCAHLAGIDVRWKDSDEG